MRLVRRQVLVVERLAGAADRMTLEQRRLLEMLKALFALTRFVCGRHEHRAVREQRREHSRQAQHDVPRGLFSLRI
jgi:hypothetical protein